MLNLKIVHKGRKAIINIFVKTNKELEMIVSNHELQKLLESISTDLESTISYSTIDKIEKFKSNVVDLTGKFNLEINTTTEKSIEEYGSIIDNLVIQLQNFYNYFSNPIINQNLNDFLTKKRQELNSILEENSSNSTSIHISESIFLNLKNGLLHTSTCGEKSVLICAIIVLFTGLYNFWYLLIERYHAKNN